MNINCILLKRFVALFISVLILVTMIPVVALGAKSEEFNISALENSDLYSYDKFEKIWTLSGTYKKEYSDILIMLAVQLTDVYIQKGWGPILKVLYYDKNTDALDSVTSLDVYVDGAIFSFGELESDDGTSFVFGGNVFREMMNSFNGAQEIAFRLKGIKSDGKRTFNASIDPVEQKDLSEMIQVASLLEKSKAWSADSDPENSDKLVKATMDKSGAKPKATPKPANSPNPYSKTSETYTTLQTGSFGIEVTNLQMRLIELNYLNAGGADGDYGGMTANAIAAFQHNVGLPETGVANNETQQYLYASGAPKAKNYTVMDYASVARKPDSFKGNMIQFSGRVLQVVEDGDNIIFRIATRGNYDDVVYCFYKKPAGYKRVLEKDLVNVYGTCTGVYTYTTVQNSRVTIPSCDIDRIEVRPY